MRAAQAEARKAGHLVGIGVGACIEASGLVPSKVAGAWAASPASGRGRSARARHRQGGRPDRLAQPTARATRPPLPRSWPTSWAFSVDDVDVVHGDTAVISLRHGHLRQPQHLRWRQRPGASRPTRCKLKMRKIAAHQLEAPLEDVVYDAEQGKVYVKGVAQQRQDLWRAGLRRLHRPQPARRHRAGHGSGHLLRSRQLHLPQQHPHRPGRDRPRDRRSHHPALHRGGRRGQGDQPDDRGRPGDRRRGAGRRPGAVGAGGL